MTGALRADAKPSMGFQMFDVNSNLYERRRRAPLWWYDKASDLHASAGVLWLAMRDENRERFASELDLGDGFDMGIACWPVYQMLFGMALELLFKAISVASGEEPEHSHKLNDLAARTGIDFSDSEHNMLALLTESILWAGRYPVPKRRNAVEEYNRLASDVLSDREKLKLGDLDLVVERYNNALDWEKLDSIWHKATARFMDLYGA